MRMEDITSKPMDVFREDTPSLGRIDVTYGKGASVSWLFDILQSMFMFLGVTSDKFSKEQVYDLARTIVSQYSHLKIGEVMLFISRFKAGMYGKFYGDTSYALSVSTAINTFMEERNEFYARLERERNEEKMRKEIEGAISFQEYKRRVEARGKKTNLDGLFS